MSYRLTGHDRTTTTRKSPSRIRPIAVLTFLITGLLASFSISIAQATSDIPPVATPALLITGIQTGGCTMDATACTEAPAMEYVEVYNPAATDLQVSGWKLRYLSSSGSTVTELASISGKLTTHSYTLFAHTGYFSGLPSIPFGSAGDTGKLAKSGGHVEIADSSGVSIDRVGWGSAAAPLVKAAAAPAAGKALQRRADDNGKLIHIGNNSQDFNVIDAPSPQSGGFTAPEPEPTPPAPEIPSPTTPAPTDPTPPVSAPAEPTPTTPAVTCEGVIISEVMPNPAGSDTGHEFIELYNPTNEVIALDGCSLQSTASTSKTYLFTQASLQSGEYRSFSDAITGITLPNSAGGTVWLLNATQELQTVTYPANMDDDTVWSFSAGAWAVSYTATPGTANIAAPVKPCDDSAQVRNPETGRCATPETTTTANSDTPTAAASTSSSLTPCKAGQERNPETNRCRAVTSASATTASSLTPCKEGQERNPETNRCKAIGSTASTATAPCPTGQERNPETNRCKKITASAGTGNNISDVKDVTAAGTAGNSHQKPYWLIAAFVAVVAIAYAIYEWRQEIRLFFSRRFGKGRQSELAQVAVR